MTQELRNAPLPMSFAFAGDHNPVKLVAGLRCPHCGRGLQAYDIKINGFGGAEVDNDGNVNIEGFDITLTCGGGCHRDIMTVEVDIITVEVKAIETVIPDWKP
jgi:hypothetical protein